MFVGVQIRYKNDMGVDYWSGNWVGGVCVVMGVGYCFFFRKYSI